MAVLCVADALGGAVDGGLGGLAAVASDNGLGCVEGGCGGHLREGLRERGHGYLRAGCRGQLGLWGFWKEVGGNTAAVRWWDRGLK